MNPEMVRNPTLSDLLAGLVPGAPAVAVSGVALDSRRARPGDLFLALRGRRDTMQAHIVEAIARGAVAICSEGATVRCGAADGIARVELPRLALHASGIAARFFGEPSRSLAVVGVTGTNGKTTVSWLIAQGLHRQRAHAPAAVIGTLGYGRPGMLKPTMHTTPDAVELQRVLSELRGGGTRAVALEVSSHALVQGRANAVQFDVAVLTNLSRDHLDYHDDFGDYAAAKARLFARPELSRLVLNLDDPFGIDLCARHSDGVPVIGYTSGVEVPRGVASVAGVVRATSIRADARGTLVELQTPYGPATLESALLGRFNAANLLAALAAMLALEAPLESAVSALAEAAAPPGRLERFGGDGDPLVLVDYAHTPDALENVLQTARTLGNGRVWCVFGCGGDRDRGKRPQMGAAAARLSDVIVLTSDNPRSEDPEAILDDIEAGITATSRRRRIADRARAIRTAIAGAVPGDVVLIAGKGHEEFQLVGAERFAFSDRAEVLAALRERRP